MSREVRTVAKLELRSDGSPGLRGYAAKFNTRSKPIYGMFTEEIAPGAFKRTLSEGEINVRALYNHKADFLLGSTRGGTVRLSEDETGLAVDLDLPDTQLGRDVQALVTRGDLYGMSFAFNAREDKWVFAQERGQLDHRTLTDVDLYDVSVVTDPAYEDTEVAVRSYKAHQAKKADLLGLWHMQLRLASMV
jgi:HK97 family phage prohead protease